MTDTFKGIITADGKKRQLPYNAVVEAPISDETLSIKGAFADAKVVGDNFKKTKVETDSLKEDISTKITKFYASSQGETHLTDSDNGKIMDMMLYGKSEQKQYSGKNLINSDEYYSEYKQSDGTYKGVVNNFNDILVPISKYIGTQITASCKVIVPPNTSFVLIEATINGTTTKGSRIESSKSGVTSVTIVPKTENDTIRITYGTGGSGIVVVSEFQIEKGSEATSYEPYVGGQPSPSPDYPQEIKSVVNPTVKVTNEDGLKVQSVTLNNITLNAIPVSSGGNVTINGQQYIADYVDVERGIIIRNILKWRLADVKSAFNNTVWHINISKLGIDGSKIGLSNMFKIQNNRYMDVTISELYIATDGKAASLNMRGMTDEEFKKWLSEKNPEAYNVLTVAEEIPITLEETSAFKQLMTYYPVTNISVNSEQLDGYTVFNYPISMANGWNYVKQQLNDNRDYIYDMDLQSAEAYVNSEYAVALTELEV